MWTQRIKGKKTNHTTLIRTSDTMQSMRYGLWIHFSAVSWRLTASSGCPLCLKIYGSFQQLTSVFFAFSVWVVCYTLTWRIWLQKVSLIVPLSFCHLMWGDSKVLFFVEYLSAVRLYQNQHVMPIPTPAPEFHSSGWKVFEGAWEHSFKGATFDLVSPLPTYAIYRLSL